MRESKGELDEIFRQMDRMRKAWEHVSPSKKLNKSQFGTLFALARLSGGREQCPECGSAAQCKAAPRGETITRGETAALGETAVRKGTTASGETTEKADPATRVGHMANAEPAMRCGHTANAEPAMRCGNAANAEPAMRCGNAANAESGEPPESAAPVPPAAPAAKPVTLSELAGAMRQSLPALSQRVTALEEKGFVERVADPADRRVTGLRLTETGRNEMDNAFRRFSGILSRAAERVGKQNMRLLLQLLGELADALNEAAEEAGKE